MLLEISALPPAFGYERSLYNFPLFNKLLAYNCSQRNQNRQLFTHLIELICPVHVTHTTDFAILHKLKDLQTHRLPQLPAVLETCPLPWDVGLKQPDVIVP